MRVRLDKAADAIYLDLTGNEIDSSEEVSEGVILDYDKNGLLVGIEILDASKRTGDTNMAMFRSIGVDLQAA